MIEHVCHECGSRFAPGRADAFLCGSACKSRRYRRRKAARTVAEVQAATRLFASLRARAGMLPDD